MASAHAGLTCESASDTSAAEPLYDGVPEEYARLLHEKDAEINTLRAEVEDFAVQLFQLQPAASTRSLANQSAHRLMSMRNFGSLRRVPPAPQSSSHAPSPMSALSKKSMSIRFADSVNTRRVSITSADSTASGHQPTWREQLTAINEEMEYYREACRQAEKEVIALEDRIEDIEGVCTCGAAKPAISEDTARTIPVAAVGDTAPPPAVSAVAATTAAAATPAAMSSASIHDLLAEVSRRARQLEADNAALQRDQTNANTKRPTQLEEAAVCWTRN